MKSGDIHLIAFQRRKGVNLRQLTAKITFGCRKIMVKENRSRKLVSRCVIAAMALVITMSCAADTSNSSDAVKAADASEAAQAVTAANTGDVTDSTVALSMSTFQASQNASTSSVFSAAQTGLMSAVSTTAVKTSEKSASTTAAKPAQTTAASTVKTTAAAKAAVTTKAAPVTTAKKVVATTTKATTAAPAPVSTTVVPLVGNNKGAALMIAEKTYDTDYTHPYNAQTNKIHVHWNPVAGASKYMLFVKGGQYADWTNIATVAATDYMASGLRRDTTYAFAVKSVDASGKASELSKSINIKTARMDYSAAGWQAMCRIVFHEVGGASGSFWDKPIVYVADCVTNQYVCAKYTYKGNWASYYRRYSSVESIIYTSGGFASDATLAARGATYARVTDKVKRAVWGAAYGITYYNNIANDYNIYYWNSTSYAVSSPKLGYSFRTPWGNYVNIWRQYWG